MPQAQLDGIDAGCMRKLVHEALDREGIDEATDRAQRAGAHRQPLQHVMHDPLVGEVVDRDRIALAGRLASRQRVDAGRLLERRIEVPRRQQGRAVLQSGPGNVGIAPELMAPVADASLASVAPSIATTIAGPNGSQASSSSCLHCSLTGWPSTARASSTASSAASSAPLWP